MNPTYLNSAPSITRTYRSKSFCANPHSDERNVGSFKSASPLRHRSSSRMLKDPLKPSSVLCGARETIQKMDEHCVICAFECFVPLHRLALVARVRGRQKIGLFELNEHSKLTRDV